tara:strand:- start:21068 stop:22060 length:993 start_codon:yes stop_codon:yes gene_type:complete
MLRSKKGIFFTLISIALVVIVSLVVREPIVGTSEFEEIRINQLDNFFDSVQNNYLENALRVSAHNALLSMSLYAGKKQAYIEDFDKAFSEVVLTGEITQGGITEDIDTVTQQNLMVGNTLNDFIEIIRTQSLDVFKVDLDIGVLKSVGVWQVEPWVVKVGTNTSINLTGQTANWTTFHKNINTELNIFEFPDPMLSAEFGGTYDRLIFNTTIEPLEWNIANLNNHVGLGTYAHFENSFGPSFLQRFYDPGLRSICCGIESILDGSALTPTDMTNRRSSVDYEYSRGVDCSSVVMKEVTGISAGNKPVYMTQSHVNLYQVDLYSEDTCPSG